MLRALAGLLVLSVAGCGDAVSDYCDAWADCEGGNDRDRVACVALLDGEANAAEAYECGDEWSERMTCREKYSTCDNGHLRSHSACESEDDKLDACVDRASVNEP